MLGCSLSGVGGPIIKLRRSYARLSFIMGSPIALSLGLDIAMGPSKVLVGRLVLPELLVFILYSVWLLSGKPHCRQNPRLILALVVSFNFTHLPLW